MYTTPEIRDLLTQLATQPAATLEGQTLDFKEWDPRSMKKSVDQLLVLRHLLYHPEIDTATAAHLCQRAEAEARALLNELSHQLGYLERGGAGRGTYWTLSRTLHEQWFDAQHRERNRRIDWEAAKHRVLTALLEHTSAAEAGLSNTAIRQLTRFDRQQVKRLMAQLQAEGQVTMVGKGKYARWVHTPAA